MNTHHQLAQFSNPFSGDCEIDRPLACLGDGVGIVVDAAGDAVGAVGDFAIDTVFNGLVTWVLRGPALLAGAIFEFVIGQDSVDLNQAWFRDGPFATFTRLSLGIMVLAMIVGAGYYVLLGQWRMVAKLLVVYPVVAILATAAVVTIADLLIDWVDAVSNDLIDGAGDELQTYIDSMIGELGEPSADGVSGAVAGGILTVLFAVFFMIGGIIVLFTLMFRSALIYLLVAMMPIVFAAAVFPGARRFARRMIDISLTLIFSKLVIAVALSVGAAMINEGTTQGDGVLEPLLKLGSGAVLLAGAGIAPWYLLSVVPAAGAAVSGAHLGQGAVRTGTSMGSQATSTATRLSSSPSATVVGGGEGGGGGDGGGGGGGGDGGDGGQAAGVASAANETVKDGGGGGPEAGTRSTSAGPDPDYERSGPDPDYERYGPDPDYEAGPGDSSGATSPPSAADKAGSATAPTAQPAQPTATKADQ